MPWIGPRGECGPIPKEGSWLDSFWKFFLIFEICRELILDLWGYIFYLISKDPLVYFNKLLVNLLRFMDFWETRESNLSLEIVISIFYRILYMILE